MKSPAEGQWQDWVGRYQVLTDCVTEWSARALAATLDREDLSGLRAGDVVPAIWTWLCFAPLASQSRLGLDGHPQTGDFLPPIPLGRRMWAGSRCVFHKPVHIGAVLTKTSTILKVTRKVGGSGEMVFVTVRHATAGGGEILMEEEQDLVFLAIPDRLSPPAPTPLPVCDRSDMR